MGLKIGNPGKGSVPHQAIVHYTEKSLKRYQPGFDFERVGVSSTLGVQPDDLLLMPDGGRVPIQACYRNQRDYDDNLKCCLW